jgi:enoyl-CoA hydratase/carnithine racemase
MTESIDEQVLHRIEDGVAWITLNRPDAANAITYQQRNRVIEHLEAASADYHVRAVVVTAAGSRHFCTGADLRAGQPDIAKPDDAPNIPSGHVSRNIRVGAQKLVAAILDCEKPVIGAINGTAAGIGAHIASSSPPTRPSSSRSSCAAASCPTAAAPTCSPASSASRRPRSSCSSATSSRSRRPIASAS